MDHNVGDTVALKAKVSWIDTNDTSLPYKVKFANGDSHWISEADITGSIEKAAPPLGQVRKDPRGRMWIRRPWRMIDGENGARWSCISGYEMLTRTDDNVSDWPIVDQVATV